MNWVTSPNKTTHLNLAPPACKGKCTSPSPREHLGALLDRTIDLRQFFVRNRFVRKFSDDSFFDDKHVCATVFSATAYFYDKHVCATVFCATSTFVRQFLVRQFLVRQAFLCKTEPSFAPRMTVRDFCSTTSTIAGRRPGGVGAEPPTKQNQ